MKQNGLNFNKFKLLKMQKYQVLERIGEGAYGIVLKCRSNNNQSPTNNDHNDNNRQIVAMKQFKQGEDNQLIKKTTMREVKILKMLNHPNIVQLREAYRRKGIVYLIFQYVRNNLLQILEESPDGLEYEVIRVIIFQVLKGLAYLHSMNIIHRDIKPQNLLIGFQNQVKICDFGFARVLKKNLKEPLTDYVATRWYRSPQLLVGAPYDKSLDIWAVGCILGELIDGSPMFPGENQFDQLFLIQKCLGPLTPQHQQFFLKNPRFIGVKFPEIKTLQTIDKRYLGKFTSKGLHFLKQTLKMNPAQRLTAQQALMHPYFEGLEKEKISMRNSITMHNDSRITERDQLVQTTAIVRQNSKKSKILSNAKAERQKTQHSVNKNSRIYKQNPKLTVGKKKKEDNFINSKGMNNFNTSSGVKSLGKTRKSSKDNYDSSSNSKRHTIIQKPKRQTLTKTQTGFYIAGGIIYENSDEDNSSFQKNHRINRNKIYNTKSPRKNNYRRENINTEEIIEQEPERVNQFSSQFPFLIMGQKPGDKKIQPIHQITNGFSKSKSIIQNAPNIVITNTFNYKH